MKLNELFEHLKTVGLEVKGAQAQAQLGRETELTGLSVVLMFAPLEERKEDGKDESGTSE